MLAMRSMQLTVACELFARVRLGDRRTNASSLLRATTAGAAAAVATGGGA